MTSLTSTTATTSPAISSASSAQAYPARIQKRRTILWVGLLVVLGGVGVGIAWAAATWRASAAELASVDKFTVSPRSFTVVLKEKGELKAAKSTDIACEVEGTSKIISLVAEGTTVKKGDLLVELASDQIDNRIRQEELKEANAITAYDAARTELEIQRDQNASDIRKAKLDIELKTIELKKYQEGEWSQKLKDADIDIQQAEINLKRRTEDYEASKQLYERDFITKTEFQEAEFSFQKAGWDLEKAQKAKEVLETYTHVVDLRRRESDLEEATKEHDRVVKNADAEEAKKLGAVNGKKKELDLTQDDLAKFRRQKEKCRIVAPTEGIVVYYSGGGGRHFMSDDSQIREGATVYERQVLLTLPDTKEMQVLVRVHEAKTNKLELGQRVLVRVEGVPDKIFSGSVTKIAVVADSQNRWLNPDLKEYETEITLSPTDVPLKPGVTAFAEIMVKTVDNRLAVPVQSIFSKAGKRYVFQSHRGGEVEPVSIQLGAIGTEWAEVEEGLKGRELILLAFNDEHKRLIPDERGSAGDSRGGRRPDAAGTGGPPSGERMRGPRRERPNAGAPAGRTPDANTHTMARPGDAGKAHESTPKPATP